MLRHFALLTLVMSWMLASCQEAPTPAPLVEITVEPAPSDNTFVVWGLSGLTPDIDNLLTARFRERHPETEVIIIDQGWDEALRQNLENAIQMGRPPDIIIGENYFRYFAARGEMLPITDLMQQYEAEMIPATYAAARYEDEIYAMPFLTGIFAFERNCSVITRAGLDCDNPPQYWDELLEEARLITETGAGDYYGYTLQGPGGTAIGSAFRIALYQAQLDALPCSDEACTIPDFDKPELVPVFEFVRELVQYLPPGLLENTNEGQVYEVLFRGVSAYQVAGSWHPVWAQSAGCTECRYSPVPIPREGHAANLVVGNVLFGIPADSRHPEMAKEWLELLFSEEIQNMIFTSVGRLPSRRSVLESLQSTVDEATAVFINELLTNPDIRILPQWDRAPKETWAIYNTLLEAVLMTDRPIPDIMAEAQQQVEALQ